MMLFADRLADAVRRKGNPSVLGLDPRLDYIPGDIITKAFRIHGENHKGVAEAFYEFNTRLIEAVCDIIPVVKIQSAFYEAYGIHGIDTMLRTIITARNKGMLIICDAKRNDIGSTAEAYSSAYLGTSPSGTGKRQPVFDADALTVNPFLGYDGIRPFIEDCMQYGKGIFILVKTSNRSSGEIQDLITASGRTVYEVLAGLVEEWGSSTVGRCGYSSIGAVVGATYPEQAAVLRDIMPHAYILVPGYGAQGGSAEDAAVSFGDDGYGAVVNASRSIMCAYMKTETAGVSGGDILEKAAIEEAIRMKNEIACALQKKGAIRE